MDALYSRRPARSAPLLLAVLLVFALPSPASAARETIRRVSVKPDGGQVKRPSGFGTVSNNGRFVVFISDSGKLVPNDTNDFTDVFVFDRRNGTTERVNVASDGSQMLGPWGSENTHVDISGDGRFVVFSTVSPGLVPNDTESHNDVFVRDRKKDKTTRVSVASNGDQADADSFEPVISSNGRYIGFQSVAENISDVPLPNDPFTVVRSYVHDRKEDTTSLVSLSSDGDVSNDHTAGINLSGDGRYAAFDSRATNLSNTDRRRTGDVFVRDLFLGRTKHVSKSTREEPGNEGSFEPTISGDGRFVSFTSEATNLVGHDDNDQLDVFVRDREKGVTKRVSVASDGGEGNGFSFGGEVAANAPVAVFVSRATNFQGGTDSDDIFRHNWRTGKTKLVSTSFRGGAADDHCIRPHVSGDGRIVTFTSQASNLVRHDTNDVSDQFVWKP